MEDYTYHHLKGMIVDIIDGENTATSVERLQKDIDDAYQNGNITDHQYDDLCRYMQDLEE